MNGGLKIAASAAMAGHSYAQSTADRWSAVIDVAEVKLDESGEIHWESALYRSFANGRLHLEFDGEGNGFSRIAGAQVQGLYERDVLRNAVLWIVGIGSKVVAAVLGGMRTL